MGPRACHARGEHLNINDSGTKIHGLHRLGNVVGELGISRGCGLSLMPLRIGGKRAEMFGELVKDRDISLRQSTALRTIDCLAFG